MNLLHSLLDAIIRLDGDALVMHVGEKPYVVTASATMNEYRGPVAWGQVELSTRVLTTDAVLGMLGQILTLDQRQALEEYGAIEHEIAPAAGSPYRFTVVAARGGDDVWLEVRRRAIAALPVAESPADDEAPEGIERQADAGMITDAASATVPDAETEAPHFEIVHDELQSAPTDADVDAMLAAPLAAMDAAPRLAPSPPERTEPEPASEPAAAIRQEPEAVWPEPVALESDPIPISEPAAVEPEPVPMRVPAAAFEPEAEPVTQAAASRDVAIEWEPEPVVEPAPQPAITLLQEPEPVSEETVGLEAEPPAVPPATGPVAAGEPERRRSRRQRRGLPEAMPVVRPPVTFETEPEAVVQRVPAAAAAIEPEPEPIAETVVQPAAAFEQEPQAIVEGVAASAVTLEDEPQVVRETVIATAARTLEPEPIREQPIVIRPEAEPADVRSEELPAEPVAAIELEPPDVRVRRAVAPPVTIEPEPEPIREVLVAVEREPQPVSRAGPAIDPETPTVAEPAAATVPEPVIAAAASTPTSPPDAAPVREQVETPREPAAEAASTPSPRAPEPGVEPEPFVTQIDAPADQRPAVVLPISRSPIKTDQPAEARPAAALPLDRVLRIAAARGAATVYVIAQSAPMIRVDGEISALDGETPWTSSDIDRLVMDLAPARVRDGGQVSGEWVTDVPDVGRVRCLTFRDHRGPGVIFRMIPPRAISAEQLGLSVEIQALCSQSDGLVLVTGARASGKSTLLSAFVDVINRTRSDHVITIEPQIGFVHESRRSFVSQREVRGDSEQTAAAVRSAFREDPDVLMIEDLRTPEIVALALEAAESGRLVFGSIPASSTVAAVDRLIELFPAERRAQAQTSLAGSLRGVVSQVLLRKSRGGRVAAREVLLNTPAVAGLIMEGKTFQLPVALDSGRRQGMMPLADSLAALVREGIVQPAEAYRKALDREALLTILRREGVDTSFVERLA